MDAERLAQWKEIIALDPSDPSSHFGLGKELFDAGDHARAAEEFKTAIGLDERYTAAYRLLGNALEKTNRLAEAMAVYQKGLQIAEETGDLQAGKEMQVFLKRLEEK